jgi:hypothetical protein
MRPRLGLAEERRPARRTESPVHLVATVRDASIVVRLSGHFEGGSAEASVDRSAARTDILALPAPAHTRDNRRLRAFPADCPAEASSCDRHSVFQAKEAILESYVGGHKFGKHVRSTSRQSQGWSNRSILCNMKMATGKVVGGKVVLEGVSLEEGTLVTVLAKDEEGGFDLTPEQEAELLLSIAESDRGETVSAEEVLGKLARRRG